MQGTRPCRYFESGMIETGRSDRGDAAPTASFDTQLPYKQQPVGVGRLWRRCPVPWLLVCILAFLCAACSRHEYVGTVFEEVEPAASIRGQNYDGSPFELADLIGDPVLIFFGYTFCPDICPLTMMELVATQRALEEEAPALAAELKVVFVSLDPKRDSLARLEPYVHAFNSRFYGVRVLENELDALKPAYGLYAAAAEGQSLADEYYLLDHTSGVYLIDREGNWRALFSADVTAEALTADLQALLR